MTRTALCPLICLVSSMLIGCSAANNSLRGKVIEGNINFVCIVDQHDERLKSPGLEGVTVEARGSNAAATLFSSVKSDTNGDFTLRFGDQQQVLLKPVEFSGFKDGYSPSREVMNLPPSDRRLLIILKPGGPAHPSPSR